MCLLDFMLITEQTDSQLNEVTQKLTNNTGKQKIENGNPK